MPHDSTHPNTFEEALAAGYRPAVYIADHGQVHWFDGWTGPQHAGAGELALIRLNEELQVWEELRVRVRLVAEVEGATFAFHREHAKDDTDAAVSRMLAGLAASLGS